jgi:hypothetical protein
VGEAPEKDFAGPVVELIYANPILERAASCHGGLISVGRFQHPGGFLILLRWLANIHILYLGLSFALFDEQYGGSGEMIAHG